MKGTWETEDCVSLITSLHAGGQELNEPLKGICECKCVVNTPARRLHAGSDSQRTFICRQRLNREKLTLMRESATFVRKLFMRGEEH